MICNLTPEVRDILRILWKRGEIALGAISPLSTIFCHLLLDFHVKTGTGLSPREKQLFQINEAEIKNVDCKYILIISTIQSKTNHFS